MGCSFMSAIMREASRLFVPEPKQGRRGKAVPAIRRSSSRSRLADARSRLRRTVLRSPEVMVKITGTGRDMRSIRASARYVSRRESLPLEDARGDSYVGTGAVADALATWEKGGAGAAIPKTSGNRRESLNIVLSMPADVDRPSVARAARTFAARTFSNHDYLIADHSDTEHPHSHLIVRMTGHDGRRLNPRKADLARWRETFADSLREQGLDANATRRSVRGVVRRPVGQAILHMERTGRRPRVVEQQIAAARAELVTGVPKANPAAAAIADTRRQVLTSYGRIARELVSGDDADRKLSLAVTRFAQAMAPVEKTKRRELVESLQAEPETIRRREPESER